MRYARNGMFIALATALVFGLSMTAAAQEQENPGALAEVNIVWGMPLGEFEDRLNDAAPGVTVVLGGPVPGLPFAFGTELGLLNYGTSNYLEVSRVDVPTSVVNVEAGNKILMGHLLARLTPFTGSFQIYGDALVGVRYFSSHVHVESDVATADDDAIIIIGDGVVLDNGGVSVASRFSDLAPSFGVGGGIEIRVLTQEVGWQASRTATIALSVGARYFFGMEATYLQRDSIRREGRRIVLGVDESRTDMLVPQIGLRVHL